MSSFSKSFGTVVSGENVDSDNVQLRRGPWTHDEDTLLIQNVARHGEGRWNLQARRSGLKRTGKSCRLRWLNYLKPDVKRGNLTPHEQVSILELHSKWGNRWSKIAQHLPGRTDNEIKNYWRTRVQKQARHLKIDANSRAFQEIVQGFWMPRLLQKMGGSSSSSSSSSLAGISENPSVSDQQNFQNSASAQCHQVPCEQRLVGENGRANKFDSSSSSDSEQGIGANISSSESINFSQVSQFSDYPSAAASTHNAHDTSGGYFCQFENNRYDMEALNQQPESTIPSPVVTGDFDNWVDEYDLGAHNMWNMDELWQFRNS